MKIEEIFESKLQPGPKVWKGQSYGPETWKPGDPEPISLTMASFAATKEDNSYLITYFARFHDGKWELTVEDHTLTTKSKPSPIRKVLGKNFKSMNDVYKAALLNWKGPLL